MSYVVEGPVPAPDGSTERRRLGIQDGRFIDPGPQEPDLTFEDGWLLPAAIDMHVHFREPGFEHKEDLGSGSTSAAFGGVALAVDMPNTEPATVTPRAYERKAKLVEREAVVDVGLWAGVDPELRCFELEDRPIGYKLYAGPTTGELLIDDRGTWDDAVERAGLTGRPLIVHGEDPDLLRQAAAGEHDREDPASHARMRPGEAEARVFERLAPLAASKGTNLHAAHVSDPRTVEVCEAHGATTEITPHHALLDHTDVQRLGAYAKCNPPIREAQTRVQLWSMLQEGRIGCVASDHAPHTREEKDTGFHTAPSGLPGVETLYPLLLAKVKAGEIGLGRVLAACCRNPAEILGVPAGTFQQGAWANLVHVPDEPRTIRSADLHSRCGWTPFEGHDGLFPDAVMVRGRFAVRDRVLVASQGDGRFVGGPGWRS